MSSSKETKKALQSVQKHARKAVIDGVAKHHGADVREGKVKAISKKKLESLLPKKALSKAKAQLEPIDDEPLPIFPYFPVAYGWEENTSTSASSSYTPAVFVPNKARSTCESCGKVRSHILDTRKSPGLIGSKQEVSCLCPWCVSSGEAAKVFNGCFVASIAECDDEDESKSTCTDSVDPSQRYSALMERTPGFNSWTGCPWASHCGDGCEYHGELRISDIASLKGKKSTLERFVKENPELFASEQGEECEESEEGIEAGDQSDTEESGVPKGSVDEVDTEEAENEGALIKMPSEEEILETLRECYSGPGSDPAVYKFVCRHCREVVLSCDYT